MLHYFVSMVGGGGGEALTQVSNCTAYSLSLSLSLVLYESLLLGALVAAEAKRDVTLHSSSSSSSGPKERKPLFVRECGFPNHSLAIDQPINYSVLGGGPLSARIYTARTLRGDKVSKFFFPV